MNDLGGVDVFEASQELVEEELIVFFSEGLVALDDLSEVCIHHFGDDVAEWAKTYTSSNYSLDLGRMIVSMLMIFSCLSSLSSLNSRRVRFAKILCSKALSIFLMATRSFPSVFDSLSLAATTMPYAPCPTK